MKLAWSCAILRRQFTSSNVSSLLSSRKVLVLFLMVDRNALDMVSLSVLATSTASRMLSAQPWATSVSTQNVLQALMQGPFGK